MKGNFKELSGRRFGKARSNRTRSDLDTIQDLHHRGYPDWQIAKELGCSRSLISLRIRELGIRNEHD